MDGLLALQNRYFIGNLDPAEHTDGFISVQHSPGWWARAIDDGGVHVAVTPEGEVVGFIAVTAVQLLKAAVVAPVDAVVFGAALTILYSSTHRYTAPALVGAAALVGFILVQPGGR